EGTLRALAVTHAAVIEAQDGKAGGGEFARHQHELAVAAHAVLRSADDEEDADAAAPRLWLMQDAEHAGTPACHLEHAPGSRGAAHAQLPPRDACSPGPAKASAVAAMMAALTVISVAAQYGSPVKVRTRTS